MEQLKANGGEIILEQLKVGYFVKMYPRLSETFILNEILELERRGVEVVIFSMLRPKEERHHPQVAQVKAPVHYLDGPKVKGGWSVLRKHWPTLWPRREHLWELLEERIANDNADSLKLFSGAAMAAALALDLGLDHLHAHFASQSSTVAYFASRISGIGFSFTAHAKDIYVHGIDEGLLEEKINAARFVVTVTGFNKRHLDSTFTAAAADKIKLVYNGINLDFFNSVEGSAREEDLILAVGRLVAKKGFPDLLSACSVLKQRGVPFRCSIVGDGEQKALLESLIQDQGLGGRVELLGPKTQDEVRQYMRQASVFVLPCIMDSDGNQDALPTVLLEALAMGCPIVSTTISGVPEIVDDGVDGLLARPGDPAAIATAIEKILAVPGLASEFASQGRFKAEERFDLRKNVATLEEHFRKTVLGNSPRLVAGLESIGGKNGLEDSLLVL